MKFFQEIDYLGQELTIYSPSNFHLYSNLGHKIYTKYIVQLRKKNRYHEKVNNLEFVCVIVDATIALFFLANTM